MSRQGQMGLIATLVAVPLGELLLIVLKVILRERFRD
jgi:hypothetical protein